MPEEIPKEITEVKPTETERSPEAKTLTFKKSKFITYATLALFLGIAASLASYFVGYDSGASSNEPIIEVKKTETKKTEKTESLVEAKLGEEVKVKSGITIKLESAEIDQNYESQKEESRKYYEKNSSESAYLESDYFKFSYLKLRVSLNNSGTVTASYNPGDFRLKDSEDVQYVYSTGEQKPLYNLNPKEKTKITPSYYVPSDEKNFELIFENAVISFKI